MLKKGDISKSMEAFINKVNDAPVDDRQRQVKAYAEQLETTIFAAIKKIDIVIPSGTIQVTGANSGGPVLSVNTQPIIIQLALK